MYNIGDWVRFNQPSPDGLIRADDTATVTDFMTKTFHYKVRLDSTGQVVTVPEYVLEIVKMSGLKAMLDADDSNSPGHITHYRPAAPPASVGLKPAVHSIIMRNLRGGV